MSASEKAKGKAEQVKGTVKKEVGRSVGNEGMIAKGQAQQSEGAAREAKEKVKDTFKNRG
ncbi:CsbD family protein [Streptomyces nigrescens]